MAFLITRNLAGGLPKLLLRGLDVNPITPPPPPAPSGPTNIGVISDTPSLLFDHIGSFPGVTSSVGTLPAGGALQISWQVYFQVAPVTIEIFLQASIDGIRWYTIDTITGADGFIKQVFTSAVFVRAVFGQMDQGFVTSVSVNVYKTTSIPIDEQPVPPVEEPPIEIPPEEPPIDPPVDPPDPPETEDEFILDDFSSLRVTNPEEVGVTKPINSHIWGLYTDYADSVPATFSPTTVGSASPVWSGAANRLRNNFNQDLEYTSDEWESNPYYPLGKPNFQFYFRPYLNTGNFVSPKHFAWNRAYLFVQNPEDWVFGRVNRYRMRVRVPSTLSFQPLAYHNYEFANFIKAFSCSEVAQEGGHPENGDGTNPYIGAGWHWYHTANLAYMHGAWWTCDWDTHPQHQRQAPGGAEQGDMIYIDFSQTGFDFTYYDQLAGHYIDMPFDRALGDNADHYIAKPTFRTVVGEDVFNISNMHGCFDVVDNITHVGWNRAKGDAYEAIGFTIKYSFAGPITDFNAATSPSIPTITPLPGSGPYSQMNWEVNDIDWTGQNEIWVAVRADGETLFHQIHIVP